MYEKNICKFIPKTNDSDAIHTINFVLETKPQKYNGLKSSSFYRIHYVSKGSGTLHLCYSSHKISEGDIFFVIPSVPYAIEGENSLEYMYISYLGTRANMITDRLGISYKTCVFHGFSEVEDFWKNSLGAPVEACDLRCESVLLYTFSVMIEKLLISGNETKIADAVTQIKKYIDENFSDSDLSLDKISAVLSYNKKYISTVFKNKFKTGVSEYISILRIQHACTLIQQGVTSIKNVAYLCGFHDPAYFSKVFRKKMGVSPKEHIKKGLSQ